ncbi:unnamed protein product [Brachionus calyciflorus]|uniref:Retinol dehydrogenase 13-like protein n=1 Tax=Brachionus calyciflorus TaxID=104777 RepID=A0A814LKC8_9BILA|nr:unnamed protein product [Brachionus calyciflorus]
MDCLIEFAHQHRYALICLASLASVIYLSNRFYFSGGRCKSNARLDGKTVIITGANTGIGKETALDLARRGARVILACRDLQKSLEASEQIRKLTGNGNVFVELLDLSSMDSIRKFSEKIIKQEENVHILINNAGVSMCPNRRTKDGFEMQFGVNHLGHFLLTNLLLDKIKNSAPSRIINVSSLSHERAEINWNDINSEKNYDSKKAYGQSKLANVLFTRELALRLKGTKVSVFAVHPGVVRTEIDRGLAESFGWFFKLTKFLVYPVFCWFSKNSEQGAQTSIYCAVDESVINLSGSYFSDCKSKQLLPHALNEDDSKKLWELSENMTKLK